MCVCENKCVKITHTQVKIITKEEGGREREREREMSRWGGREMGIGVLRETNNNKNNNKITSCLFTVLHQHIIVHYQDLDWVV